MSRRPLPYDQLNWNRYAAEPTLKLCSFAAQGVWPRMLAIMWHASERGCFLIAGKSPPVGDLAELWGKPPEQIPPLLAELEARGVFSRDERGVAYCRCMVRDEQTRQAKDGVTPTDRAVADRAVGEALAVLSKDDKRKADGRARQRRYRQRQRAGGALEAMQAFAHMEAEASRQSVTPSVTSSVTVTLHPCAVTLHNSSENRDLCPVSTESESESEKIEVHSGIAELRSIAGRARRRG